MDPSQRLNLDKILREILGTSNVYFQPPDTIKMKYPAIVYSRDDIENDHADNGVYMQSTVYQVVVIDRDPDSEIVTKVSKMPKCTFDRHYAADNLNHDVFTLYF